jgi:hypothetical protein
MYISKTIRDKKNNLEQLVDLYLLALAEILAPAMKSDPCCKSNSSPLSLSSWKSTRATSLVTYWNNKKSEYEHGKLRRKTLAELCLKTNLNEFQKYVLGTK